MANMNGTGLELLITGCKDPMMWYSSKVGDRVELVKVVRGGYVSKETRNGCLNLIKAADACHVLPRQAVAKAAGFKQVENLAQELDALPRVTSPSFAKGAHQAWIPYALLMGTPGVGADTARTGYPKWIGGDPVRHDRLLMVRDDLLRSPNPDKHVIKSAMDMVVTIEIVADAIARMMIL